MAGTLRRSFVADRNACLKMGFRSVVTLGVTDNPERDMASRFVFASVPNPKASAAEKFADFTHHNRIRTRWKFSARDENIVEAGLWHKLKRPVWSKQNRALHTDDLAKIGVRLSYSQQT